MKISLAQLNPIVGDIAGNLEKCIQAILLGEAQKTDLVVLPELITTGYPPRDLLNRKDFIKANLESRDRLVELTKDLNTAIAFGYVHPNDHDDVGDAEGKPNFNAVCVAAKGKIIHHRFKTLLPTYDVFEEDIYFEPGDTTEGGINQGYAEIAGVKLGFVICEEAWNDKEFWVKRLYEFDPVYEIITTQGVAGIISINASPFRLGVNDTRHEMISKVCKDHNVFFAYCNMVGYNDDVGFDGNSFAMNSDGELIASALAFTEDLITLDTESSALPEFMENEPEMEVIRALSLGISDYFAKTGIKGPAIIGLSGGIDSALVAYLAVVALGPNRVIGVGMPSEFSSDHSKSDAYKLAKKLGIHWAEMPIENPHNSIRQAFDLGIPAINYDNRPVARFPNSAYTDCKDSGVTDENLQARIRGMYLMAISNFHNGLVLSTGNKSEMAVGYCTMYGDMCGGLAVISDVKKTLVFRICEYINKISRDEIIPWNTIRKPPSAELRPNQTDQQSLPPYWLLDEVMVRYVEQYQSPDEIKKELAGENDMMAYLRNENRMMTDDIDKVCRLIRNSQYKRVQSPTGLKITSRLFKMGYRMPIARKWD